MKNTVSLVRNGDFRRLYASKTSAGDGFTVVYTRRNGRKINRLGITVSTKIGNAVVRNRIRRRFKEIYRLHEDMYLPGTDTVIVARSRAVGARYVELERSLLSLFRRTGLCREQQTAERRQPADKTAPAGQTAAAKNAV